MNLDDLNLDDLVFAADGVLVPYVAKAPLAGVPRDREAPVLCVPYLRREGGLLVALPTGSVPPALLSQGQDDLPESLHGPSTVLEVPAVEETEDGEEEAVPETVSVLVVDVSLGALAYLSLYDPVETPVAVAFDPDAPNQTGSQSPPSC